MTKNAETVTAPAPAVKGKQVSATIAPDLYEALEEYRWTVRLSFTDLVRKAVEEYAANHNVPNVGGESESA